MNAGRGLVLRELAWGALAAFALFLASGSASAEGRRLSLVEAVGRAKQNPLAVAAAYRTRAAEAQMDEARGARWPRAVLTSFIAPSPDIHCEDPACTRTSPRDPTINVAGVFGGVRVDVFQPLYTFGKIDAAIDATASQARMQDALAAVAVRDLSLDTARAYFGVKLARELVLMLEDGSEQLTRGQQKLSERLDAGDADVTVQDRLRLATFAAELQARLSEGREGRATALFAFRALVGDWGVEPDLEPFEAFDSKVSDPQGSLEQAALARPELRAARHGVAALEGAERMEEARWAPDLLVTAGVNWARAGGVDDPPSAFANDPFNTTTAQAALVMRWTVEPAMQAARVARARAELDRGRALAAASARAGTFSVLQAQTRAVEARKRVGIARDGERSARGWVASVVQADAVGTASAKDLADAYLAYFTLHGRYLQSVYDWNVAVLALRAAVGESPLVPARP